MAFSTLPTSKSLLDESPEEQFEHGGLLAHGELLHKKGWRIQRHTFLMKDMRVLYWYKDASRSKPDGFVCLDGYV